MFGRARARSLQFSSPSPPSRPPMAGPPCQIGPNQFTPREAQWWIPTRSATPSTALVPQRKVGFPIPNARLLLGFQGIKTARREGISSLFSDAGGCTSPQNSGASAHARLKPSRPLRHGQGGRIDPPAGKPASGHLRGLAGPAGATRVISKNALLLYSSLRPPRQARGRASAFARIVAAIQSAASAISRAGSMAVAKSTRTGSR